MKTARIVAATTLLVLGGVSVSGCNFVQQKISEKVNEAVIENASGGQFEVDSSDNEYTITTQDGTVQVGSQDISAVTNVVTLPDWISGGEQSGVMSSKAEGKLSVYASLVSSRSVDETYDYFVQYLGDQGFGDITKADYAGTKMVSGTKGPDNQTSVAVTVSEPSDESVRGVKVVVVYSGPAQQE